MMFTDIQKDIHIYNKTNPFRFYTCASMASQSLERLYATWPE